MLDKVILQVGEFGFTLGDALILIALGVFFVVFSRLIRKITQRLSDGRDANEQANIYIVGRLSYYGIIFFATLFGLSALGLDVTQIALLASALSVGIGFGLQAIFNNLVSGIILMFDRSIKVGDLVELADGLFGTVKEINIRSTRINTPDNLDVIVPNSEFVNNRVNNWTYSDRYRRLRIPFGVHYRSDKEVVKQAGLEAAAAVDATLLNVADKPPMVWLVEFADSALLFELVVWVNPNVMSKPTALKASYMWELETALKKHHIEIPYPQRDVHIRYPESELAN